MEFKFVIYPNGLFFINNNNKDLEYFIHYLISRTTNCKNTVKMFNHFGKMYPKQLKKIKKEIYKNSLNRNSNYMVNLFKRAFKNCHKIQIVKEKYNENR